MIKFMPSFSFGRVSKFDPDKLMSAVLLFKMVTHKAGPSLVYYVPLYLDKSRISHLLY